MIDSLLLYRIDLLCSLFEIIDTYIRQQSIEKYT